MAHENELIEQRIKKLNLFKDKGIEPYSARYFKKTSDIQPAISDFKEGLQVALAGRLMALRRHGKSAFGDLTDATGKMQIYVRKDSLGEDNFSAFELLDIGDIIGVKGTLFRTKTGEPTVVVTEWTLLSKSLRPLPEKWHGLKDTETRFRQRYVDIIMSEEVRALFVLRSKIITAVRNFLDTKGYLEVETPMMQHSAGGAIAKPFQTYHNALDTKLYLRIAPELYLKRLLVAGYQKVYELNRNFRNEGLSTRHNPEFTMLEAYTAYVDYREVMELTEQLIRHVAKEALGAVSVKFGDKTIDLSGPFKRVSIFHALKEYTGKDFKDASLEDIKHIASELAVEFDNTYTAWDIIDKIFQKAIEPKLIEPTFIIDYPVQLCPLAKRKEADPALTERFELFAGAQELANAYSELNDPIEQRDRFLKQGTIVDEDFIRALEYGMPPAGGLGIGIDRLVMFLANKDSIREVILFPTLKAANKDQGAL